MTDATASKCGTSAGWWRHRRESTTPCEPCVLAHRVQSRRNATAYRTRQGRPPKPPRECSSCGKQLKGQYRAANSESTCKACRTIPKQRKSKPPKQLTIPFDSRSWLRRSVEDGDRAGTIAAIKSDSLVAPSGCWIWQRQVKGGYGQANFSGRMVAIHRLALEAKHGAPLGTQQAHHVCANRLCVNPDHLQPVTHMANMAEMQARNSYLARIEELETALATLDPAHPLLDLIPVA